MGDECLIRDDGDQDVPYVIDGTRHVGRFK